MSGFKADGSHDACIEGALPGLDADAPAVAGFESGEAVLGVGGDEVVADGFLMAEEFIVHDDAYGVLAAVFGAGIAFAIAIEAGERICAAGLEDGAENVFYHEFTGYRERTGTDCATGT